MLSLFKKNSFFNSMMLLVYATILNIIPSLARPAHSDIFGLKGIMATIIHILVLFIQAAFINRMIIENRLHRDIMLYPGVFFILFSSLLPAHWNFSHIHIANFFIIWGIFELFHIYKTTNPAVHIFNASFLVGIASLFCSPMIFFLFLLFIGITNLKKMELVHPIQIAVGGGVPWFLYITYKVWKGNEGEIIDAFLPHFGTTFFSFKGGTMNTVFLILFALVTFFLFLSYNEVRKKKHIQAQKKVDILYLSLITSILVMVFHGDPGGLIFMMPFIGIFVGLLVSHITNTSISEMIHLFLFIGVLVIQILSLFKIV